MNNKIVLQMKNISKSFPGVKALDKVNLDLREGEVHVLLGENGAGKSTLMKILVGIYQPDEGTIVHNGKEVDFSSYKDAENAGISIVYQEFNLISGLSVAENIYYGRYPKKKGIIDWDKLNNDAQKILDRLGVNFKPTDKVSKLSTAQQQMVEIAKALSVSAHIIVMDEPTASLTEKEIDGLFRVIKEMKKDGISIVYISHRLEELEEIGDRVTILRDGLYVDSVNINDVTTDDLITMMVGRSLDNLYPKIQVEPGEVVLECKNLNSGELLKNVSFYTRKGEIVGFAGLMGAGRTETMRAIFGADRYESGQIFINGEEVNITSPMDAINHGIGFLTEDRKEQGLILSNTIGYNISITNLDRILKKNLFFHTLDEKIEEENNKNLVKNLDIRTPSIEQLARNLSGGNQQKVVLAKWLNRDSKVLIFDEPTRGIDVGAKTEIYKLMNELVKRGVSIIMVSSDLPELLGMADRIYVMHEGRISGELNREDFSQNVILQHAAGLL